MKMSKNLIWVALLGLRKKGNAGFIIFKPVWLAIMVFSLITFKPIFTTASPIEVPGCSKNIIVNYGQTGFVASDFSLTNVDITSDRMIMLNTGFHAIDPNRIIIPFTQEVAVTFLFEGAGYTLNDFGWMLASDGPNGTKHDVYVQINDNNGNGVLDIGPSNNANRYGDRNGDRVVNARDNREVIGTFEAGTELVFYLRVPQSSYGPGDLAPSTEKPVYFYTKTDWNKDVYRGSCTDDPLLKTYYLGRPLANEGTCSNSSNWMTTTSLNRARDVFGLQFDYDDTATLTINRGQRFSHVMVGAPRSNPNSWILGWEDLAGGGDTDHNDMVFIIERRTGGRAQINSPLMPQESESFYTGATFNVVDHMPCVGKTEIKYYVSIDNGANWVAINKWDEMWETNASKEPVRQLTSWTPGSPAYTRRTIRIDFVGRGLTGRELIWRADFFSDQVGCEPKVMDVILDADTATNGTFSRSSPVAKANMVYSGFYETPAFSWRDKSLRGHLTATQLYDPLQPGVTSTRQVWDAGAMLTAKGPAARTIYFPQISVGTVSDQTVTTDNSTNGLERTFSGRISHVPIMTTTLSITDGRETFIDKHTNVLEGNLGGHGTINRFTGEFSITFNQAPIEGVPIRASYQYYSSEKALKRFESSSVTRQLFGLDDSYIHPTGYVYDFDRDGDVDDDDAHLLMNWVRGYQLGTSTPREWLLEPIDHSTPALLTPPGRPLWYYGTATSKAEQANFDQFAETHKNRRSVVFVGSRAGMLHAFDAGDFRYGDNACTPDVAEERGYFKWNSNCPPVPSNPDPNYGTGDELWAFIPANLLPRLKNNLLAKMNRERTTDYDQAFVDASPALADVYINNSWRTVLLSAQGNGGDTVFCLDVTDPLAPKFMWEFADPDLFRSRSSPSIAKIGRIVRNGKPKWVAFFVSGNDDRYDRTQYPSVYMIDIETGAVLERIFLTADDEGLGGVPSGQPAIVDSDGNGYIDRFYIGTDKGFMYKVNIPDDPDAVKYTFNQCVINRDYTDSRNASVPSERRYQPIYGSPVVSVNNTVNTDFSLNYKVRVFYGTGDSPYYKDDINTALTRYYFFAYEDTAPKGVCQESLSNLDWFYELPEGHRVFASAFAAAGTIYFGTSTAETEDPCESGGLSNNNGYLFAFGMDNPRDTQGNVVPKLSERVGNIVASPVVYDQHLFYKSFDGCNTPRILGGGRWNNETITVPSGIEVLIWRERYR